MPTINNPYSFESPYADSLTALSKSFMTGPDEATKIYRAESALKLKNAREGRQATADAMRRVGQPGFDLPGALSSAFMGDINPEQIGTAQRVYNANTYGAADPRTDNSVVGAGGSFTSTADAFRQTKAQNQTQFDATLAENQRQFDNKPYVYGSDTGPVIGTQGTVVGKPAVEDLSKVKGNAARVAMNKPGGLAAADDTTKTFIDAKDNRTQTPRNYIGPKGEKLITYDGISDARTGAPLPQGGMIAGVEGTPEQSGLTKTVEGKLQEQNISQKRFGALLAHTRDLAQKDPTNFGVAGFVKGVLQDTGQMAGNIATGLGYTGMEDALKDVRQRAASSGVNPSLVAGLFDPGLPALQSAADLLAYSAAEALAGQSGRSVSDKDVKLIKTVLGDPAEWMMSQGKYLAKLDTVEQILQINQTVTSQALRGDGGSAPAAAPAAPAGASVPPPPAPAGAPPSIEKWGRGPDGSIQRVQ